MGVPSSSPWACAALGTRSCQCQSQGVRGAWGIGPLFWKLVRFVAQDQPSPCSPFPLPGICFAPLLPASSSCKCSHSQGEVQQL